MPLSQCLQPYSMIKLFFIEIYHIVTKMFSKSSTAELGRSWNHTQQIPRKFVGTAESPKSRVIIRKLSKNEIMIVKMSLKHVEKRRNCSLAIHRFAKA